MTGNGEAARTVIRPYGDTTGDGRVQVSFTLPVPFGTEEERALAEGYFNPASEFMENSDSEAGTAGAGQ